MDVPCGSGIDPVYEYAAYLPADASAALASVTATLPSAFART